MLLVYSKRFTINNDNTIEQIKQFNINRQLLGNLTLTEQFNRQFNINSSSMTMSVIVVYLTMTIMNNENNRLNIYYNNYTKSYIVY